MNVIGILSLWASSFLIFDATAKPAHFDEPKDSREIIVHSIFQFEAMRNLGRNSRDPWTSIGDEFPRALTFMEEHRQTLKDSVLNISFLQTLDRAQDFLLKLLDDGNVQIRGASLFLLGALYDQKDSAIENALYLKLQDKDIHVQAAAAIAITTLEDADTQSKVEQSLLQRPLGKKKAIRSGWFLAAYGYFLKAKDMTEQARWLNCLLTSLHSPTSVSEEDAYATLSLVKHMIVQDEKNDFKNIDRIRLTPQSQEALSNWLSKLSELEEAAKNPQWKSDLEAALKHLNKAEAHKIHASADAQ